MYHLINEKEYCINKLCGYAMTLLDVYFAVIIT